MTTRSGHVRRALSAGVAALVLVVISLQPAGAAPSVPADGETATIEANGRWFPRDAQGRALNLHGYNIKLAADRIGEVTPAQLAGMVANGFDVLRLAIFWADLEPTEGAWNDQYFADLADVLDMAEAAGVKVVLDMHQDSYSPAVGGFGMPDWTTRTDGLVYSDPPIPCLDAANQRAWEHFYTDTDLQDAQVTAWLEVVDRLGSHPAVFGYDVLNEPCGEMLPGEDFVEALQRVEATQITPMLQRVTDAIRTVDTTHWIFLEGAFALTSTFAAPAGLGPVSDPTGRQIYAPHIYDLGMESGADWDPASDFVTEFYANIVGYATANQLPINVFEWGPQSPALPNAADYVSQVMHGADAHTAGWAGFAWCRALGGWCQLDSEGNPGAGMTDNTQVYPRAIAGRPLSIEGDYGAGVSWLTVDPVDSGASGPTEFFFPLRRFAAGPAVLVDVPDDAWSSSWDPETQVLSVTVEADSAYTITVYPADSEPPVRPTDPDPEEPDVPGSTTTTVAAPVTTVTDTPSTTVAEAPSTGPAPTSGGTHRSGSGGELPRTGSSTGSLLVFGLALAASGMVLEVARRRRSARV